MTEESSTSSQELEKETAKLETCAEVEAEAGNDKLLEENREIRRLCNELTQSVKLQSDLIEALQQENKALKEEITSLKRVIEDKEQKLYRKVRGILNKLTPQKFQTLTQQILDLEIETPEQLEGLTDLIFEKAISEPRFSEAYANLCRCLIPIRVITKGEDGKKVTVTFRKILLNKCQREFEKEKKDEMAVHEKINEFANQGLSAEEFEVKNEELELKELKAKQRALGNIIFIGELFKLKMLTEAIIHECVLKLLKSNDEESFECLCELLFTIGKDLDHEKAKPRVDQYFQHIANAVSLKKTSFRVRFMLQDVQDLRKMKWVPRREDNKPTTIDQIHKEAADKVKKTRRSKRMQKKDRGMPGCHDSPHLMAQADESWTTVGRGPRSMSVDPKKFQNVKHPTGIDSENISLGPGGRRGFGAWARGSSGGSGAVSTGTAAAVAVNAGAPGLTSGEGGRLNRYVKVPAPQLSEEQVKKKTLPIIEEYLSIRDMKETTLCVKDLESPGILYAFVVMALNHTLEKHNVQRRGVGMLLHALIKEGLLTVTQYIKGVKQVLETAKDMVIDIPLIYRYLGEIIGPSLKNDRLLLTQLNDAILQSISDKGTGAKLLSEVLLAAIDATCESDVAELWSRSRLSIQEYFSSAADAEKFVRDKKIEFTLKTAGLGREEVSRKHAPPIREELGYLFLERKAKNEDVFSWIDSNVKAMKTGVPFLRTLVMCVGEECITRDDRSKCTCNSDVLRYRKPLLQVHLNGHPQRQLQALYALQELFVKLEHPKGFLHSFFNAFHDENLISEESFFAWEKSEDQCEQKGRRIAKNDVKDFLEWLRSDSEESSEDS